MPLPGLVPKKKSTKRKKNVKEKKSSVLSGSGRTNAGLHSNARTSASPIRMEETGVPWLDDMQQSLQTKYHETTLMGMKVGTHEAFTSKFAPQLRGGGDSAMPPPPDYKNTPQTSTALVPAQQSLSLSAGRKLAPLPVTTAGIPVPCAPAISLDAAKHSSPLKHAQMNLNDYEILAVACQRGGRGKTEAYAHFKMGEMCSKNPDTIGKAGKCFERYYTLCKHLKDADGEAKALNCLGIIHQQMGDLGAALQCHQAHLNIAPPSGQFIAHINIGVIQMHLGRLDEALQSHKDAMHSAIRSGEKQSELVALANLGMVGQKQKDYNTAQVCLLS